MRLTTTVPALLGLVLYWPGLRAWFQKDDFAWLGLLRGVHSAGGLAGALFAPQAQGTLRVLSERAYFMGLESIFGLRALPFHVVSFLTFAVCTVMIARVGERLSGSRMAGVAAALLWTVNGVLAYAMSWSSLYNQLACALVFLLALWLLMEGRYAAQWAVYLIGFGVLETNVVYPAIATAWALAYAPRMVRKTLVMFVPAVAYAALHFALAPAAASGTYRLYFGANLLTSLVADWKLALGPSRLALVGVHPSFVRSAVTIALTLALLGALAMDARRRRWATAFGAVWFVVTLAPLLPLRDHQQDYYLTIPAIGLALWAGDAIVRWPRAGVALAVVYAVVGIAVGQHVTREFYTRSAVVQRVVEGIVEAERGQAAKAPVVVTGVDHEMFVSAFQHRPLALYGLDEVFVDPASRAGIGADAAGAEWDALFGNPVGARRYDVRER